MNVFSKEKPIGAIVLSAAGQEWDQPCRITGILWEGTTTAGDRVEVKGRNGSKNAMFWPGKTDTTSTYMGMTWERPGQHAPDGFKAERLDSGILYVYLSE